MQAPSDLHWKAVKRVLRYLRGTIQIGLCITPIDEFNLHVYSDADWSRDIVDRVSTSGCILFLGHNPISWSSKKQNTVSRSSTESEYRAVANALSETLWVTNLLMSYAFQYISYPKFIVTILEPHSWARILSSIVVLSMLLWTFTLFATMLTFKGFVLFMSMVRSNSRHPHQGTF